MPVDMAEIARETVQLARTRFRLTEEALVYEERPGALAPIVTGDADELKAAVWNLIDNAIKYSPDGKGVRVTVEEAEGERIALRVTDRGVGISAPELKRIFRRFYRVPASVAMRVKGSGLGLFIVRSVAKRHGGRAYAQSEGTGKGSTFTMLLPRAPQEVRSTGAARVDAAAPAVKR
jgi:signal transduction histidine kinase